jgi:hypothetical protein
MKSFQHYFAFLVLAVGCSSSSSAPVPGSILPDGSCVPWDDNWNTWGADPASVAGEPAGTADWTLSNASTSGSTMGSASYYPGNGDLQIAFVDDATGAQLTIEWPTCGGGRPPTGTFSIVDGRDAKLHSTQMWGTYASDPTMLSSSQTLASGVVTLSASRADAIVGTFSVDAIDGTHLEGEFYANCDDNARSEGVCN